MKKIVLLTLVVSCQLWAGKSNPQRTPQQAGTGGIGKMAKTKTFTYNDISCKGKSTGKRPVITTFTGEMSEGKVSNVFLSVEKNGLKVHRFSDHGSVTVKASKANSENFIADLSDGDKAYKVQVEFPQAGQGRGQIQILERGTKDVLSSANLTCRTKNDPSLREKNELCIEVAKSYAAKQIKSNYKGGVLDGGEPQVEDNKFTGVYVLGFSFNEECGNSVTVKTKMKVLPNKQMSCEAYDFEFGEQECG